MRFILLSAGLLLAACHSPDDGEVPGNRDDTQPYAGVGVDETIRFTGTEPFWGGEVTGTRLRYSTPEDQDGTTISVERFAGRGGLSYSGSLVGEELVMAVTPGDCSDGMSDRTYPFVVTLKIGDDTRSGCGWSEAQPFSGPAQP